MISAGQLADAILVFGAFFYLALALLFGHGVWLGLRARWVTPRLARGRALLVEATSSAPFDPEPLRPLRTLSLRLRFRLVIELAAHLSGTRRQNVHGVAHELGLVSAAEALAGSRFWWRRLRGVRTLTVIGGGEQVVPPLLDDPHPVVRAAAADWAAGHPEAVVIERLLAHLADPSSLCRFTVRDSLLRMRARVVEPLARYLDTHQGAGLEPALDVAAALAAPVFLQPACRFARSPEAQVRARAAELIGAIGGGEAVDALAELLLDPEPEVRSAAADAVGKLGHWPGAVAVARLLRDPSWRVRRAAGLALREMGSPGVLMLRRALRDADPFAADMARQVLDLPGSSAT